jgi:Carboxypeptidase regulatory-like domain
MGDTMGLGCGVGRSVAAARVWLVVLGCGMSWVGPGGCGLSALAWGQGGTDGGIDGQVLNFGGKPLAGAVVIVRSQETKLEVRTRTGAKGEFLAVRLPPGGYEVRIETVGAPPTVRGPVEVGLGGVTFVIAQVQAAASTTTTVAHSPTARQNAGAGGTATGHLAVAPTGSQVMEAELAGLPVDGGEWGSLALTVPGANAVAGPDEDADEVSFRGIAVTQNSSRLDGASGDQSFGGSKAGGGVQAESDAGMEGGAEGAAGAGDGTGASGDGGRRAGASYTFAQGAVREFRVNGQVDAAGYGSALYGHGVGGVVTTVSKSGGKTLHGMGFYTLRQSAWAAANPFSIETQYANGVVASGIVKPQDTRQQGGGSVGGPVAGTRGAGKDGLYYFYAFDQQRRSFPAISSPAYAGFYTLTATQKALLGNRGVSTAKTNAALNYLDSLTGTVARALRSRRHR